MTNLLIILNNLSKKIINQKGDLSLFALAKLSDTGKWNLLIVANWCKRQSVEAYKYLYDEFKSECLKYSNSKDKDQIDAEISEFLEFPFVILPEHSSLVQGLKRLYHSNPVHISPVAINAYSDKKIEEIYLFATDDKTDRSKFEFYEYGRFSEEFLDRV